MREIVDLREIVTFVYRYFCLPIATVAKRRRKVLFLTNGNIYFSSNGWKSSQVNFIIASEEMKLLPGI